MRFYKGLLFLCPPPSLRKFINSSFHTPFHQISNFLHDITAFLTPFSYHLIKKKLSACCPFNQSPQMISFFLQEIHLRCYKQKSQDACISISTDDILSNSPKLTLLPCYLQDCWTCTFDSLKFIIRSTVHDRLYTPVHTLVPYFKKFLLGCISLCTQCWMAT